MNKLSILIPIFNEKNTISELIASVEEVNLPYEKELILIDDKSHDGTRELLEQYKDRHKVVLKDKNGGKGDALRAGFKHVTGDLVIIQDADLEYDPNEYRELLEPIIRGHADVVYGSRFVTAYPRRVLYFSHYMANKLVTFISNIFTGLNLSDMETGYKVFNRRAFDRIHPHLVSRRFGIEPEITARIAKAGLRVYEVGISYKGRTYAEGKKINWKDGLAAIWHIVRFNLFG